MAADSIRSQTATPPKYAAFREPVHLANGSKRDETRRMIGLGHPQENKVYLKNDDSAENEVAKAPVDETEQLKKKQSHHHHSTTPSPVKEAINEINEELALLGNPETTTPQQIGIIYVINEQIEQIDPQDRSEIQGKFYKTVKDVIDRNLAQYRNSLKGGPDSLPGDPFALLAILDIIKECSEAESIGPNNTSTLRANAERQLSAVLRPVIQSQLRLATRSDGDLRAFIETFKTVRFSIETINAISPNNSSQVQVWLRTMIENLPHEKQIALVELIGASFGTLQEQSSRDEKIQQSIADQLAVFTFVAVAQPSDHHLPTNLEQAFTHFKNVNVRLVAFTQTMPSQNTEGYNYRYVGFQNEFVKKSFPIMGEAYVAEFANPKLDHKARQALVKQFNGALADYIKSLRQKFPNLSEAFLKQQVNELKKEMVTTLLGEAAKLITNKKDADNYATLFTEYSAAINTIRDEPKANAIEVSTAN